MNVLALESIVGFVALIVVAFLAIVFWPIGKGK